MGAGTWTTAEVALLKEAVVRFGLPSTDAEWRRISDAVGTRDGLKCKQKWVHLASTPRPRWTEQHDIEIQSRVDAGQKWAQIAREAFNGCDPQAVQNRFRSTARTARPGAGVGGGGSGVGKHVSAAVALLWRPSVRSLRHEYFQLHSPRFGMSRATGVCVLSTQ